MEPYKQGLLTSLRTKSVQGIEPLNEFCAAIFPHVEEKIYGSSVTVNCPYGEVKLKKVFSESQESPDKDGLFHADRHFEEATRMIVYLSDVDEGSAPFEYLCNKSTGKTVRIKVADHPRDTIAGGRVPPETMKRYE
ncbi:hypothetical protein, partial [Mesomycoplasma ovipneumoniae]|uniref:hypothetical protein n=1 Tax=Mesomycoplasma ovipneumoniae TaxID=29562 RepID=UPI00308010B8